MRNLVVVLGDQLSRKSSAFDGFDRNADVAWMVEAAEESRHVWTHKARIAMFLSAMRHFSQKLVRDQMCLEYHRLDDPKTRPALGDQLAQGIRCFRPLKVIVAEPGEWRVEQMLQRVTADCGVPLEIREDRSFYCTRGEFARYAASRSQLRMEYFYRAQRRRHRVLMNGEEPEGGRWNYDSENRRSFGKSGPGRVPLPKRFVPDSITRDVLRLTEERFRNHPGELSDFAWPVTDEHALEALEDFTTHRLAHFGAYQDAMWTSEAFLYHSCLSAAMNLKLLDPRDAVSAAELAYRDGSASLEAVEGFVRQILGWREYVRGVYWNAMPEYLERNQLEAREPLPAFYWTGDTEMRCLRESVLQSLRFGYAHHSQRLMVTGLYALLLGVDPRKVHEWYLAVYVDAVEWVELPNTLGMSQYADGGVMASKPYIASGKYIQRMSNYCAGCRFDPSESTGAGACPFTTLYWDFLMRHEPLLATNLRMKMQVKNLARLSGPLRAAIQSRAAEIRACGGEPRETSCSQEASDGL